MPINTLLYLFQQSNLEERSATNIQSHFLFRNRAFSILDNEDV